MTKDQLTKETLRGLFKNNFDLANCCIQLAEYYVKSGHEVNVEKLLGEIKRNPSEQYLKDLQMMEDEDEEVGDEKSPGE